MNIVADTNVLVAGLLSPFGVCGKIVRMISAGDLTLLLDARILSEYYEVLLRPKFKFDRDKVKEFLDYVKYRGQIVAPVPLLNPLPDTDDEPFLEIAVAGEAVCLITGNVAHFPLKLRQGVKVLLPREFVDLYREYLLRRKDR